MISKKYFLIIFSLVLFLLFAAQVNAATLYLLPEAKSFGINKEFSVDVKINTEETSINAAQAVINFPNDVLELLSVDKQNSAFNFWVEEPVFSNKDGSLSFIGGTAKGVSGESLQILEMKFKTIGIGSAEITASDAVVTASDGKGTNVLSTIEGTSIGVDTKVIEPEPAPAIEEVEPAPEPIPEPAPESVPKPIERPQLIVREPVLAKNLPQKPEVRVPLYPDQSKWYGQLGEVIVLWDVPDDVIRVANALDKSPNTLPPDLKEKLFTGKSFGVLGEGIWYAHVQFRNNLGWGETTHYKMSIDTTAPLPFEIQMDSPVTDDPKPEIRFETQDSLSGISEALIFIDDKEPIKSTETAMELPLQSPGKHRLLVRVSDLAGNSVEDDLEFEILALPSPIIDFLTKTVSQGEFIFASGKTIPSGFVDVKVLNKAGKEAFAGVVNSDGLGNWEIAIEEPMTRGAYVFTAVARDSRGATSYPTDEEALKIKAKVIIAVGLVDLGWFEIALVILLLVISGASISAWYYASLKKLRTAYKTVAGRDIDKLTKILSEDLKGLESWVKKSKGALERRAKPEMELYLNRLRSTVNKMRKYLRQELDKLR